MENIFRSVLNMSITGAYIAIAIILVRQLMKRLPKRYSYALWLILGIRLVCPFSLSSAASLFNLIKPETEKSVMTYIPEDIAHSETPSITVSVPQINEQISESLPVPVPENSADPMQIIMSVCTCVWLVGMCAVLIYTAVSYIKVKRLVRESRHLTDNIYVCGRIEAPFVFGVFRPKIYIPEGVSERDMSYIAAHENTHISRGDHIIKLLSMPILSLHWFNPMVWISYRLMVKDMELSCDERAVMSFSGDVRKEYAEALLNMSLRRNRLYGLLAFGESDIKMRIKRVLSLKQPTAIAALTAVIIIIAAGVCLLTNAEKSGLSLPDKAGSYSVAELTYYGEAEEKPADRDIAFEWIDMINKSELKSISESSLPDIDGGLYTDYELRMYDDTDCTGDYDFFRICRMGEVYYAVYRADGGSEYYEMTKETYNELCHAFSKHFPIFKTGSYSHADNDGYLLTIGTGGYSFELSRDGETVLKGLLSDIVNDTLTRYYCENGERVLAFMWNGGSVSVSLADGSMDERCGRYDYISDIGYSGKNLGSSFVISKAGEGYEVRSPLTDIYLYFSETGSGIKVRRDKNGAVDEKALSISLNPAYSDISLWDITGDGTDDIFIFTHFTETGVVDNAVGVIDGESMEEIIVDRASAERLITEHYDYFLSDDDFSSGDPYISGLAAEGVFDDDIIYPLYPDKSVKRFGGMSFGLRDGVFHGDSVFCFVEEGEKFSEVYKADVSFGFSNGRLIAEKLIIPETGGSEMDISDYEELSEEIELCESYLTDYWSYLMKTGSFEPEKYISDPEMLLYAEAKRKENEDKTGHNVLRVSAVCDRDNEIQSGVTDGGRTWISFLYNVDVYLTDGTVDNRGFKGYRAYFELEGEGEDMKIFREYELWGAGLFEAGLTLGEDIALPLKNVDVNEARKRIDHRIVEWEWVEESRDFPLSYNKKVVLSFMIPIEWNMGYSTASVNGGKVFELGMPYHISEGIDPERFKIDEAHGDEITVNEEKYGGEDDLFEYYIFTSLPDKYSPDGVYDAYHYVVRDGDHYVDLSFIADAGTSDDVISQVLGSVSIKEENRR